MATDKDTKAADKAVGEAKKVEPIVAPPQGTQTPSKLSQLLNPPPGQFVQVSARIPEKDRDEMRTLLGARGLTMGEFCAAAILDALVVLRASAVPPAAEE